MAEIFDTSKNSKYFYSKGFNLVRVVSFICGAIAYFAVYDSINYMARNVLFNIFTGIGFSCIVAAAVYYLLSRIPSINSYILRKK